MNRIDLIRVTLLMGLAWARGNPLTPPSTPWTTPWTTPWKTTPAPECQEDDQLGYYSCSFICGLNGQWRPRIQFGGKEPPGSEICPKQGDTVYATCPLVCSHGDWLYPPCYNCCEEYDNHCHITCYDGGFDMDEGCDPFAPPSTPVPQP